MAKFQYYFSKNKLSFNPLNRWDLAAFILIIGAIFLLAFGTHEMAAPYQVGQTLPISLNPTYLPYYALRTVLRMFFALFFSLLFTFIFGTWAAKSKRARKLIIPAIDILQSVPVIGFLTITVTGFIILFHGSMLGPECAAIFTIFTAQVWNMALSFYQSLRTVPPDLVEASYMLQLSAWQRFWRLEVPFAMPALLWNTLMSMSGSWFFLVFSEAISVGNQTVMLPGIGSYISLAISQANSLAIIYSIIMMFIVILLYDQLLFRPLVLWAEKFKTDTTASEQLKQSWVTKILQRTHALKYLSNFFIPLLDGLVNLPFIKYKKNSLKMVNPRRDLVIDILWNIAVLILVASSAIFLIRFIAETIPIYEIGKVFWLGVVTGIRVLAVVVFCTLVWVPLGVWIGMRPKLAAVIQPVLQFLAAFPAYLLFPVFFYFIVNYSLNVQVWVTPLMILGTQWYVAFNVIAGTLAIPRDLHLAMNNLGVKGWLYWRKLILPAIFPYYVTGAITAVGGAWNVSMVAEVITWGHTKLTAIGIGAYIAKYTGNLPHIALGIGVMCTYVLILNRLIWRPLFNYAERRFKLE